MRSKHENGVALITALLILFLVSAIVVGMSWMVVSDQRLSGNNQDRELAFYAAEAGMEKMTADMGNVFATKGSIVAGDLPGITGTPPGIPGITYANTLGSTYQIGCPNFPCAAPVPFFATIQPPSAYSGMQAQVTPFTLRVAAQTADGAEVKFQRQVEFAPSPSSNLECFPTRTSRFSMVLHSISAAAFTPTATCGSPPIKVRSTSAATSR